MSRLVAAMCVVLAVAAATSGAATAENPVRSTYIVVLNPDAARSAGEAGSQRPLVSLLAGEIVPFTPWMSRDAAPPLREQDGSDVQQQQQ